MCKTRPFTELDKVAHLVLIGIVMETVRCPVYGWGRSSRILIAWLGHTALKWQRWNESPGITDVQPDHTMLPPTPPLFNTGRKIHSLKGLWQKTGHWAEDSSQSGTSRNTFGSGHLFIDSQLQGDSSLHFDACWAADGRLRRETRWGGGVRNFSLDSSCSLSVLLQQQPLAPVSIFFPHFHK